jgi:hypothetical protein
VLKSDILPFRQRNPWIASSLVVAGRPETWPTSLSAVGLDKVPPKRSKINYFSWGME